MAMWLCCVATSAVMSQTTLKGTVRDVNQMPVPYVNVVLLGQEKPVGVTTNEKGGFALDAPKSNHYTLRFSHTGFQTIDTTVVLPQAVHIEVVLRPATTVLREASVRERRQQQASFAHLDMHLLEHIAGPSGSVESLLKTLPDVSSNNELSSQYSVRGGSFDENLVYINHVEIVRPMLVRSGQQEGLSIINPDLISRIRFSPGGFDASYGDRMSSVLDLTYLRPDAFGAKASVSFLGASASVHGTTDSSGRMYYALGLRTHSNRYLFSKLATQGEYQTRYADLQALAGYSFNDNLDLSALVMLSRNRYGLIPESATQTFGTFSETMQFDVYFDGQEQDMYRTALGSISLHYHPNHDFGLRWTTSLQHNAEQEVYDIQSQYWLYQLLQGGDSVQRLDRGVGTYLEHARNYLSTTVLASELTASHYARLGSWNWGIKWQLENVDDRVREWKWVDSADYAMPRTYDDPGNPFSMPVAPQLQNVCYAHNALLTHRFSVFAQRQVNLLSDNGNEWNLQVGARAQYYISMADTDVDMRAARTFGGNGLLVSPRLSVGFHPGTMPNASFKFAVGMYSQPPFYREYRRDDGSLNLGLHPQHSYQTSITAEWRLKLWSRPFVWTTDVYYKYITNLVPYRVDNLRVRYDANNDAVAYATGVSTRLYGEFIPGVESWASLSLLKTQEDLLGDTLGWLDRPTDQRISFKVFLQDYMPTLPFWRMSLSLSVASGVPTVSPIRSHVEHPVRLPAYFRVDWGNAIVLTNIERCRQWRFMRLFDEVTLGLDVFNLFNYENKASFLWIVDYSNSYYPVPNRLTSRQICLKLTATF